MVVDTTTSASSPVAIHQLQKEMVVNTTTSVSSPVAVDPKQMVSSPTAMNMAGKSSMKRIVEAHVPVTRPTNYVCNALQDQEHMRKSRGHVPQVELIWERHRISSNPKMNITQRRCEANRTRITWSCVIAATQYGGIAKQL